MNRQGPRRRPPPFKEGDWVTPTDGAHPMKEKRGRVTSVEYTGQGSTDQYLVVVIFENVHPRQRKEWTFRHQDLTIAPSAQVAAPHRKEFNL